MTDSCAALSPDRLPWLPDEPKPRPLGARVTMLLCAVLITVIVAGFSYSPWTKGVRATHDSRNFSPPSPEALNVRPGEHSLDLSSKAQVQPSPAPSVLQVAVPTVAAGPQTVAAKVAPAVESPGEASNAPTANAAEPAPQAESRGIGCRFAKTRAAMAVCSNSSLATLDREHVLLYNQYWRQANAAKRALLLRARQRSVEHLNACPTDACTRGIYLAAMRKLSGIMTANVAASRPLHSKPSFSCRFASTPGEVTVCSDPNLSALDRQKALLYSQSWGRADGAKRARLLRAHERLVTRRDGCGTESCTRNVYLATMSEITDIMTKH